MRKILVLLYLMTVLLIINISAEFNSEIGFSVSTFDIVDIAFASEGDFSEMNPVGLQLTISTYYDWYLYKNAFLRLGIGYTYNGFNVDNEIEYEDDETITEERMYFKGYSDRITYPLILYLPQKDEGEYFFFGIEIEETLRYKSWGFYEEIETNNETEEVTFYQENLNSRKPPASKKINLIIGWMIDFPDKRYFKKTSMYVKFTPIEYKDKTELGAEMGFRFQF